ncbi:MAG: type II toxin-antitoxin system VapB family antitoxin [Alphaproteobacteria bacterium]|nr:type II toxin-antitoxin system VapB family antitoxin [Alphaproteobacteria bacterium]
MSLNIKNPESHTLAATLARRLGVSMTEAVTLALREKLARTPEADAAQRARAEEMRMIARRVAARLREEGLPDPDDLLYDELGLPKRGRP